MFVCWKLTCRSNKVRENKDFQQALHPIIGCNNLITYFRTRSNFMCTLNKYPPFTMSILVQYMYSHEVTQDALIRFSNCSPSSQCHLWDVPNIAHHFLSHIVWPLVQLPNIQLVASHMFITLVDKRTRYKKLHLSLCSWYVKKHINTEPATLVRSFNKYPSLELWPTKMLLQGMGKGTDSVQGVSWVLLGWAS